MVDIDNMSDNLLSEDDEIDTADTQTLSAFATESMNNLLDTMQIDNGQTQQTQLKKCKLFSMTETCVTLNPQTGSLQLAVSVGSLKAKDRFAANAWNAENELFADYDYYEFSDDDIED